MGRTITNPHIKIHHLYQQKNTELNEITTQYSLIDTWRHLHPDQRGFTRSNAPYSDTLLPKRTVQTNVKTRIDKIYISTNLLPTLQYAKHEPTIYSDHDWVHIELIHDNTTSHRSTYYKINKTILQHPKSLKRLHQHAHSQMNTKYNTTPSTIWKNYKSSLIKLTKTLSKEMKEQRTIRYNLKKTYMTH